MRFEKLRIVGFKTFVDAAEFLIEPGLTGIVGPNGCGKSNLVEALRWVMGETSHKSLRASGMDDVIFSGSATRPSRNSAEVVLVAGNEARTAPAAFNDTDRLEISRRIERDSGSTYRINGREVRARDVQLLFADAASGARSPAMVRQGQIAEIIAAKPQQRRRRIIEEAAGVAGLHQRRHEAELRLKAASDNLLRLEDVLGHLDGQASQLAGQARQAGRYKALSAEIRKAEALVAVLAGAAARERLAVARARHDEEVRRVAEATVSQGEAARALAVLDHEMEPLRKAESERRDALQRLTLARELLGEEEARLKARVTEVSRLAAALRADEAREAQLGEDGARALARLSEERDRLAATPDHVGNADARARDLAHAETEIARQDERLAAAQAEAAHRTARRAAAERALGEATARLSRAENARMEAGRALAALETSAEAADLARLSDRAGSARATLAQEETALAAAERARLDARAAETAARPALAEAERAAQRAETELRTLRKLVGGGEGGLWPRLIDAVTVEPGFEAALGAALGEDLDASTEASAPAHWRVLEGPYDAPLPDDAEPLATHVTGPPRSPDGSRRRAS